MACHCPTKLSDVPDFPDFFAKKKNKFHSQMSTFLNLYRPLILNAEYTIVDYLLLNTKNIYNFEVEKGSFHLISLFEKNPEKLIKNTLS